MEKHKCSLLLSVIIPLYNKELAIYNTVKSVLEQTYPNFELIIVDDGSTDNSSTIVQTFEDNRIKFFHKENGGASSARNFGVKYAKGDWIAFLDADDTYYPNTLKSFADVINRYDDVDIVCANFVLSITNECVWKKHFHGYIPVGNEYKWMFQKKYDVGNGRSIIKSEIIKNNPFVTDIHRYEDLEAILRWVKKARIYLITDCNSLLVHNEYNDLSKPLQEARFDYGFNLDFKNRTFWERCILGELLYETVRNYKEYRSLLMKTHIFNLQYFFITLIYKIYLKIERFVNF